MVIFIELEGRVVCEEHLQNGDGVIVVQLMFGRRISVAKLGNVSGVF